MRRLRSDTLGKALVGDDVSDCVSEDDKLIRLLIAFQSLHCRDDLRSFPLHLRQCLLCILWTDALASLLNYCDLEALAKCILDCRFNADIGRYSADDYVFYSL